MRPGQEIVSAASMVAFADAHSAGGWSAYCVRFRSSRSTRRLFGVAPRLHIFPAAVDRAVAEAAAANAERTLAGKAPLPLVVLVPDFSLTKAQRDARPAVDIAEIESDDPDAHAILAEARRAARTYLRSSLSTLIRSLARRNSPWLGLGELKALRHGPRGGTEEEHAQPDAVPKVSVMHGEVARQFFQAKRRFARKGGGRD